jgi:YidC/Oxa1 family membrane protein insertase
MLFGNVFQTYIEQPVFNLLELIYALIPGHDLGVAIILFTIVIRMALWPLVRKQLHQTKAMRKLQPELKKLKKAAGGDRQKEARLQMELYKEHGVKPFATIGTLIIQLPIFIALYQSVLKLIKDPNILQTFSYDSVRNLPWIQHLASNIQSFDHTLFSVVDLSRSAIERGGIYFPALVIAILSTIVQFYQSKMLMPDTKDARKLSVILREAGTGKQADQSEVSAAVSRGMMYVLPFFTFIFAVSVPSALALYLLTSAAVGYLQQRYILNQDTEEMLEVADEPEVVVSGSSTAKPKTKTKPVRKAKKASVKKKKKR